MSYNYDSMNDSSSLETSGFLSRMQSDVAKREEQKKINELKKTDEGKKILKQLGYMKDPRKIVSLSEREKSMVQDQTQQQLRDMVGAGTNPAPKVVVHSSTKINDKKQWDSSTWAKSTYIF